MDGPLAANSGHQGTAMALAPLAHVLYSRVMRYDPADPNWVDRDRFILSAGHVRSCNTPCSTSAAPHCRPMIFVRSVNGGQRRPVILRLVIPLVLKSRRTLGQGFANGVGMAISERLLREQFGADAINHHTWVIAGDGCLMEGVSHEAASLAGHLGLDRLVCVFDDNRITIDGDTDLAASDDVAAVSSVRMGCCRTR